ncbi:hypothetical protein [Cupriavidus gilardii]|uniref:hypothetical protein n=1 Tax=Cupriavidus gilardii TaxID=82541 RepID=UPI00157308AA|nr:hypothetical protein [Cupriavidus gilardii]NSX05070.1 hypothetical protein [Cupriavidus gilardii]
MNTKNKPQAEPESPMKAAADALRRKTELEQAHQDGYRDGFKDAQAMLAKPEQPAEEARGVDEQCDGCGGELGDAYCAGCLVDSVGTWLRSIKEDGYRTDNERCAAEILLKLAVEHRALLAAPAAGTKQAATGVAGPDTTYNLGWSAGWAAHERAYGPQAATGAQPDRVKWDKFPAWLIDHHEGDTITEELLQRALADMLKVHPPVGHSRQEQSRPVPDEGRDALPPLPYPDLWRHGAGFQGYTAKPGEGPWFTAAQMRQYAQAAQSRQPEGAALTDEEIITECIAHGMDAGVAFPADKAAICDAFRAALARAASEPRVEGALSESSADEILANHASRLAFELECCLFDNQRFFDQACAALGAYKADVEKLYPSPPTFMGEPIPAERKERYRNMRQERAAHHPTGGGNAD